MAIFPTPIGSPYPTVESVMNLARVRVADVENTIAGDLLADDLDYTPTMLNSAWRWIQAKLYSVGGELAKKEVVLYGLPVQAGMDVANQAYVTWLGCSDGVNQYDTPALPSDLVKVRSVWRRQSGSGDTNFCPMTEAKDGLPRWMDYTKYDLRTDGLYFYANTYAQDLLIRYYGFYPDLSLEQPGALVPMMMCENCLSARVAFEYASLRGGEGAAQMAQLAEDEFTTMSQSSLRKAGSTFRRIPYGGRRGFGQRWPMYINS